MLLIALLLALLGAAVLMLRKSRRSKHLPPASFISAQDLVIPTSNNANPDVEGARGQMSEDSFLGRIARAFGGGTETPPPPPPAPAQIPAIAIDYEDPRVPGGAKDRIRRILACLSELEAAMQRMEVPGFTRIDIDQMRRQHLPKLVKSYIDIPEAHRPEIFRKTGRSASFILNESLDQMQHKIDEILRNLAQYDIDAFTNNTQFIGQRYSDTNPFD